MNLFGTFLLRESDEARTTSFRVSQLGIFWRTIDREKTGRGILSTKKNRLPDRFFYL